MYYNTLYFLTYIYFVPPPHIGEHLSQIAGMRIHSRCGYVGIVLQDCLFHLTPFVPIPSFWKTQIWDREGAILCGNWVKKFYNGIKEVIRTSKQCNGWRHSFPVQMAASLREAGTYRMREGASQYGDLHRRFETGDPDQEKRRGACRRDHNLPVRDECQRPGDLRLFCYNKKWRFLSTKNPWCNHQEFLDIINRKYLKFSWKIPC